jgi:hypothetical protein
MENAMITIIDPPGALKCLLDDPSMRGVVVVSEPLPQRRRKRDCCAGPTRGAPDIRHRLGERDSDLGAECYFRKFQITGQPLFLPTVPTRVAFGGGNVDWNRGELNEHVFYR